MKFDIFGKGITLLDGAMGTMLQRRGLKPGGVPDILNLTEPELIRSIHREYIDAGSRVIYTNTFGANRLKLSRTGRSVAEVVSAAVRLGKDAAGDRALVALDIGPIGQLLEPMGSLSFEAAYDIVREQVLAGAGAGADLIVIETLSDLYEAKAALLAAKENSALPVMVTMSFEERGRSFTGCTVASMARTLEGLGADAIGFNCSLGPDRLARLVSELCANTRLPVVIKPNAGLPDPATGRYDLGPQDFAEAMLQCLEAGASLLGGCCGTAPEYIAALAEAVKDKSPGERAFVPEGFVCTPSVPLSLKGLRTVGERINPTGKKRLQKALLDGDLDYVLSLGAAQLDAGADILDVNVGYPGVDEVSMLPRVVKKLQSALPIPLQLDSSSPEALEAGLRVYNGKASVNSVNGGPDSLARILPVVKKYGAAVVGLTMDEEGVAQTAEKRVEIAERILKAALEQGIAREDVWIDCLALTISAQQEQAAETLKALRMIKSALGLRTLLGVSNISFGLPERHLITRAFLTSALAAGLDLPIMDVCRPELMDAVFAHRALSGEDAGCRDYIARFAGASADITPPSAEMTLEDAVIKGLKKEAARLAELALNDGDELGLVENRLIPALDKVGAAYEKGVMFLPQLLGAAQAAQEVFEVIRASIEKKGGAPVKKGSLALATVRGDIHDIGKNIVKTVLENYGYEVLDLGRDVPPESVAEAVRERDLKLVGLSALMTTTLPAMEETIRLLKALPAPPVVMVGGAVLNADFAKRAGADYFAKDAREAVDIARKVFE